MARGVRRRGPRTGGGSDVPSLGRRAYEVDLVLDARLFGRFRLLSIEAAVDVVEPGTGSPGVGGRGPLRNRLAPGFREPGPGSARTPTAERRVHPGRHHSNGSAPLRRADAEHILGEAERTLDEQG